MAINKKVEDTGEVSSPVGDEKSRRVIRMGDIVIYHHRRMTNNPTGQDFTKLPMIVTSVNGNNRTVNGVVFSDNASFVGMDGAKLVLEVEYGEAAGRWQFRR